MSPDPVIIEELTAYLDGELLPEEVLRVEQRLNSDPVYLAEMQSLQKTWDLLEQLPNENADNAFVRTTMELVVQDAGRQSQKKRPNHWVWPLRLLAFMTLPLLLFAGAYATTFMVKTAPHRELVNNLVLFENLEKYQRVGLDLSFLAKLDQWGLFAEDNAYPVDLDNELSADWFVYDQRNHFPSRETIDQRQARIESMSVEQKNSLRRNYELYQELTDSQKQAILQFHDELSSSSDRVPLTRVMNAYFDWLKTIERPELAHLLGQTNLDERLKTISIIKSRQVRAAFGRAGATKLPFARDAEHLFDWYDLSINSKENQIRDQFPNVISQYQQQHNSTRMIPTRTLQQYAQRQPVNQLVAILMRIDPAMIQNLVLQDIDLLRRGLSYEARAIIDFQTPSEQKELVLNWIDAANQVQATIPPERLHEFYERLPSEERDELDMMDLDSWKENLTAKYWRYHNSQRQNTDVERPDKWESFLNGSDEFGDRP